VRQIITPCLELLPRELAADSSDDRAHAVRRFAKRIRTSWGPRPILVDISLLSSSVRHETVMQLARAAERYSVSPIVVLSLFGEPPVYAAARQAAAAGIMRLALRVDYSELEKDDAADYIDMALDNLDTSPAETHLLTDYGVIDIASPNYEWLAERVPYTPSWREFVLLGGSFLRDLNGLAVGTRAHQRWIGFTGSRGRESLVTACGCQSSATTPCNTRSTMSLSKVRTLVRAFGTRPEITTGRL
jgi:hypothetical protein